jgi:hypothetical protein
MFRFSLAALWLLCLALLEGTAVAQAPFPTDVSPVKDDPGALMTLSKGWAKAKFEASQARPQGLAQARLDAAREWFQSRMQEYLAGRGALDISLEASRAVAESESAVNDSPAGRAAALAHAWAFAWAADRLTAAGYEAVRVKAADYQAGRYARLLADSRLVEALAGQERLLGEAALSAFTLVSLAGAPLPHPDEVTFSNCLRETRQAARDLFEVLHSSPADLARARLEAARGEARARLQEFLAGRGTLDILLASLQSLAEAEHAVFGRKADSVAFREMHWEIVRPIDKLCAAGHEAGRVRSADMFQARCARLEAGARLVKTRSRADQTVAPWAGLDDFLFEGDDLRFEGLEGPFAVRDLAKEKFAVSQARFTDLAAAKLAAATGWHQERASEYLAGRGTLDILLESAAHLLEAECAVDDSRAARVAALERYWQQLWQAEQLAGKGYRDGRVKAADYFQVRDLRLGAELRLVQERAAKPRP